MIQQSISRQVFLGFTGIAVMTATVLAFAVLLLLRIGGDTERLGSKLAPQVDAAMEIKLEALHAHLLTEEIMGGDSSENVAEVWAHLEASQGFARALLEGGMTDEGVFFATDSLAVRERIEEALITFDDLWSLTEMRFASLADNQGVGSDADVRFDEEYDAIASELASLGTRPGFARNTAVQIAIGEARYALAHGHLIIAEILGGDFGEDFGEATDSFMAAQQALGSLAMPETFAALMTRIDALSAVAAERYNRTLAQAETIMRGDATYDATFDAFLQSADEAETLVQNYIAAEMDKMARTRAIGSVIFGLAAIGFLIACQLAYRLLSRRIIARISELTDCIARVSDGAYDTPLPDWTAKDELGRLKAAIATFQQVLMQQQRLEEEARQAMARAEAHGAKAEVEARRTAEANSNLSSAAGLISTQSHQLLEISNQLSTRQDQQAELLKNMLHLIAGVKQSATGNTEVVREAISVAKSATSLVQEGNDLVERVVHEVQKIAESGEQVAGYVTTIKEISFQTNLLALNAAVEAARAGEAGKGFSIVAHEVRNLSQRTAQAAASIVNLMAETNDYIRTGRDSVDTAKAQFNRICEAIARLEGNLDSVGQSSGQQTHAVEEAAVVANAFQQSFGDTQKLATQCHETGKRLAEQAYGIQVEAPPHVAAA